MTLDEFLRLDNHRGAFSFGVFVQECDSMKCFLASMTVQEETAEALIRLVGKPAGEISVAFVGNAADPYEDRWFVEATRENIRRFGMRVVDVDLREHDGASLRLALFPHDVLFVNGGNTFYLLDLIRRRGLGDAIVERAREGMVYAGASAGSILAGPSIELAGFGPSGDPNDVGLARLDGLGLVPFAVWPHLTDAERASVTAGASTVSYPVVAIGDALAVVVDGMRVAVVGTGDFMESNGFSKTV